MEYINTSEDPGFNIQMGLFFLGNYHIKRFRTWCCALCQLSLNDTVPFELLRDAVESIKKESNGAVDLYSRNGGERAIFVVTLPKEGNLEYNLHKLGFTMVYQFHRRKGYPEEELLKLWILSW